jgi:hypothetical protein
MLRIHVKRVNVLGKTFYSAFLSWQAFLTGILAWQCFWTDIPDAAFFRTAKSVLFERNSFA